MKFYILRRLLYLIPMLFIISIVSFVIIQLPPGDIISSQIAELEMLYGDRAEEQVELLRTTHGLDQPVLAQYFRWIWRIITRWDFGYSFGEQRPVADIIASRLPLTIWITLVTVVFQWVIAIPIGIYSAVRQHSVFDYVATFVAFIGQAIPNFFLGLVLMYFFYTTFGWSVGGLFSPEYQRAAWSFSKFVNMVQHLIPLIIVVGTAGTAGMVRVLRGTMLDELGKPYVRTARAKGIPESRVILMHPTKVALLPMISTIGWVLPGLVSGAVIVSVVLNIPIAGASMLNALLMQDMYVAGAFVLLLSTLTVVGTLISDILLGVFDPRIRAR